MTAAQILRYIDVERYKKGITSVGMSKLMGKNYTYFSTILANVTVRGKDVRLETVIKMADAVGLELHLRPKGSIDQVETGKPLLSVEVR